jgi:hypothetical protein
MLLYLYILLICSEASKKQHQSELKITPFSKTQNGFSRKDFLFRFRFNSINQGEKTNKHAMHPNKQKEETKA